MFAMLNVPILIPSLTINMIFLAVFPPERPERLRSPEMDPKGDSTAAPAAANAVFLKKSLRFMKSM